VAPSVLAESMKMVGVRSCIMTTDFGQIDNPPAPEGLKSFITAMLDSGVPEKDIETMVKKNPAMLLKID
jgi:predicted metal-dependent phosphotriesterase family hydrolase